MSGTKTVLVILSFDLDYNGNTIYEYTLLPLNIAKIFKEHLKNNPSLSLDFGGEAHRFYFDYDEITMKIIYDKKIINAYKILNTDIVIPGFNFFDQMLYNIIRTMEKYGCGINLDDFDCHDQKIIKKVESRDRDFSRYRPTIFTKSEYEYILMFKDIICSDMKQNVY